MPAISMSTPKAKRSSLLRDVPAERDRRHRPCTAQPPRRCMTRSTRWPRPRTPPSPAAASARRCMGPENDPLPDVPAPWPEGAAVSLPVEPEPVPAVLLPEQPEHAGPWQSAGQRGGLLRRARLPQPAQQAGHGVRISRGRGRRRGLPQPLPQPPSQPSWAGCYSPGIETAFVKTARIAEACAWKSSSLDMYTRRRFTKASLSESDSATPRSFICRFW